MMNCLNHVTEEVILDMKIENKLIVKQIYEQKNNLTLPKVTFVQSA